MTTYNVTFPYIDDMGSVQPIAATESTMESWEENALWHLNRMRDHDGLEHLDELPEGTTGEPECDDISDDDLVEDDISIPQKYHSALNWMEYEQLKGLLLNYGFSVNHGESEDDLREAVRVNLMDGTIPLSDIDLSKVE